MRLQEQSAQKTLRTDYWEDDGGWWEELGTGTSWGVYLVSSSVPPALSPPAVHPKLSCTLKFFWDSGVGLSRSMSFLRSSSMVDLELGLGDARRSLVEARSLVWAISLPSL